MKLVLFGIITLFAIASLTIAWLFAWGDDLDDEEMESEDDD